MTLLQTTVGKFRSQMAALNVPKNANPEIFIRCQSPNLLKSFGAEKDIFKSLIKSGEVTAIDASAADPQGCLKSYVNEEVTIYIKIVGVIDIKLEVERVNKRNGQLQGLVDKLNKKMSFKDYEQKVPENVRKEDAEKLNGYQAEIEQNNKSIQDLKQFI